MDTDQLLTFQKLAKEKNFSRASQELGVSQPTVTMRIKALENELGETLILRTGKSVTLTSYGEVFLSYVDRALRVFQAGLDSMMDVEGSRTLTFSGIPTFNTYVLPGLLRDLREHHGELKWRIYTGTSEEILQMTVDGIHDIGVIRGTAQHDLADVYTLYPEELLLVVHHNHPLSWCESVSLKQLENEQLLIYRKNSDTWKQILARFRREGIEPKVLMELEHIVTVKQMLSTGIGIAFLPELAVREALDSGELCEVRLEEEPITRDTSVVVPKGELSYPAALFLQHMHEKYNVQHIPEEVSERLSQRLKS